MVPCRAARSATTSARAAPAAPSAAPGSATGRPSRSGTYTAAAITLAQFRHSSVRACRLERPRRRTSEQKTGVTDRLAATRVPQLAHRETSSICRQAWSLGTRVTDVVCSRCRQWSSNQGRLSLYAPARTQLRDERDVPRLPHGCAGPPLLDLQLRQRQPAVVVGAVVRYRSRHRCRHGRLRNGVDWSCFSRGWDDLWHWVCASSCWLVLMTPVVTCDREHPQA